MPFKHTRLFLSPRGHPNHALITWPASPPQLYPWGGGQSASVPWPQASHQLWCSSPCHLCPLSASTLHVRIRSRAQPGTTTARWHRGGSSSSVPWATILCPPAPLGKHLSASKPHIMPGLSWAGERAPSLPSSHRAHSPSVPKLAWLPMASGQAG